MEKCTCGRILEKVGGVKTAGGVLMGYSLKCRVHGSDYGNPKNKY